MDFFRYFGELTADRQAHPTDDLATLIANGTIDGAPMPDLELISYYVIIATAGHDTTVERDDRRAAGPHREPRPAPAAAGRPVAAAATPSTR